MKITFQLDTDDLDDISRAVEMLATLAVTEEVAPVVVTEPVGTLVTETTPINGVQPVVVAEEAAPVDSRGMPWDAEIHSDPPTTNANGTWRARRGKKKEYDAAYAGMKSVHAVPAPEPAVPQPAVITEPTMPPAPAVPEPQTPPEPIDYNDMARRFVGMMEAGKIVDFEQVYSDLQIDHSQIEVNQTMIARLWKYMDAVDTGSDHINAAVSANAG